MVSVWRLPHHCPIATPIMIDRAFEESPLTPSPLASTAGQALGKGRRENGATLLKRRLLERAGLRVVSVRHWEWEAATRAGGAEGQRAYLEGLLRPPGPPGPSPSPLRPPPAGGTAPVTRPNPSCPCTSRPCGRWREGETKGMSEVGGQGGQAMSERGE